MTDLGDFGFDVGEPEEERENDKNEPETGSSNPKYRTGRCRALTTDGTRCSSAIAGENISDDAPDLCHMHESQSIVRTIDADPVTLIEGTSRTMFDNLDDLDVDEQLIREAAHAIHGLDDMPITVTDEGVILPYRFARASKLVIRTPTKTVQMTSRGEDRAVESLHFVVADRDDWDVEEGTAQIRNERCLPSQSPSDQYSIGLKIFGHEQEWYPVEFESGDRNEYETTRAGGG